MKRMLIILALLSAALLLSGCSVLEERYTATTAKAQAKQAEAYAQAEAAHAAALETQAVQATAQVSQVEASNRLMAFLATVAAIAQNPTGYIVMIVITGMLFVFGLVAITLTGRGQR